MSINQRTLCAFACFLSACSGPDMPADNQIGDQRPADSVDGDVSPAETGTELRVRVAAPGGAQGRLIVAAFAGENAWGWTLDVLELDSPRFPEEVTFTTLEPGVVTVRAVLDRAPFDWVNPGSEDLLVTATLALQQGENNVDLALVNAPDSPAPQNPDNGVGLPVRVNCNCDGLTHLEIAILSGSGEVVQRETLSDPELPIDLTMNALAPGDYRIAWRTDDYPDWVGERGFSMPLRNAPLMVLVTAPRPDTPPNNPGNTQDPDPNNPDNGNEPNDNDDPEPNDPDNGNEPNDNDDPDPNNPDNGNEPNDNDDPDPNNPDNGNEPNDNDDPDPNNPDNGNEPDDNGEPDPNNGGDDMPNERDDLQELRETQDYPNRAEQAQPIRLGSRIFGRLSGVRDFDWFVFEIGQGEPVRIETLGTTDTRCQLVRDADGATVQDDDSGEASNCRLAFDNLSAGSYRLRVSHYSWVGQGEYTLMLDQAVAP